MYVLSLIWLLVIHSIKQSFTPVYVRYKSIEKLSKSRFETFGYKKTSNLLLVFELYISMLTALGEGVFGNFFCKCFVIDDAQFSSFGFHNAFFF